MRIAANFSIPELEQQLHAQLPDAQWLTIPSEGPVKPFNAQVLLTLPVGVSNLEEVINAADGLEWIHIFGTGADSFPIQSIKNQMLTCSRGATSTAIAEWVLAMILSYDKHLPSSWISNPPQAWNFADLQCLEDKTLGLIGFGAIGQAIAKRALSFDMTIIAKVRRHRTSSIKGITFVEDLSKLLAKSDHIVLALPATAATERLIDATAFRSMKVSAHLINVARASIIDHNALKYALDHEQLGCASLDVTEPEPLPEAHWLYQHEKVRLSPHISWYSPSALQRISKTFIDNAVAFQQGKPLSGQIDKKSGY